MEPVSPYREIEHTADWALENLEVLLNGVATSVPIETTESLTPVRVRIALARAEDLCEGPSHEGPLALRLDGRALHRKIQRMRLSRLSLVEINDGKLTPGYKMINNSIMILKGQDPDENSADFRVNRNDAGEPRTIFVPRSPESAPAAARK